MNFIKMGIYNAIKIQKKRAQTQLHSLLYNNNKVEDDESTKNKRREKN